VLRGRTLSYYVSPEDFKLQADPKGMLRLTPDSAVAMKTVDGVSMLEVGERGGEEGGGGKGAWGRMGGC
jgi:hypothetical protein